MTVLNPIILTVGGDRQMAQYDVTYSCGHTETVQIYGPHKDRERKIAWFERSGHCRACYRALKDAECAEQAAAAEQIKPRVEALLQLGVNERVAKSMIDMEADKLSEMLAKFEAMPASDAAAALIAAARHELAAREA